MPIKNKLANTIHVNNFQILAVYTIFNAPIREPARILSMITLSQKPPCSDTYNDQLSCCAWQLENPNHRVGFFIYTIVSDS